MTRAATATKPRPPKEAPEPQGTRLTVNRAEFLRALGHAAHMANKHPEFQADADAGLRDGEPPVLSVVESGKA